MQGTDLARRTAGFVEISSHEVASFRSWSPAELRHNIEVLKAAKARVIDGTMQAARYGELEGVLGLNLNPEGLLCSEALAAHLEPIAVCTYDWVHNMLQDGVLSVEIQAFFAVAGVTRQAVKNFLENPSWVFPKYHSAKAKDLHRIFDVRRISANNPDKLKASCSELLGVYGLVRHFVECEVPPSDGTDAARQSFLAVCNVMDLLLAAKFRFAPVADVWPALEAATVQFLQLHQVAHGEAFLKPKHHWQLDVPRQFQRDGCVLDAFVIERTHLNVKRVADPVRRTSTFEASVLSSLCTTAWRQALEDVPRGLLGPIAPLPGYVDTFVADRIEIFLIEISVGDVVMKGDTAGVVKACCLSAGQRCLIVDVAVVVRQVAAHSHIAKADGRLVVWDAASVRLALAWCPCEDGLLVLRQ